MIKRTVQVWIHAERCMGILWLNSIPCVREKGIGCNHRKRKLQTSSFSHTESSESSSSDEGEISDDPSTWKLSAYTRQKARKRKPAERNFVTSGSNNNDDTSSDSESNQPLSSSCEEGGGESEDEGESESVSESSEAGAVGFFDDEAMEASFGSELEEMEYEGSGESEVDDGEGEGWEEGGGGEERGFILDEAEEEEPYQAQKRRRRRRQAVSSGSSSSEDDAGQNGEKSPESEFLFDYGLHSHVKKQLTGPGMRLTLVHLYVRFCIEVYVICCVCLYLFLQKM